MTRRKTFSFNEQPGVFEVFAPDGSTVFDSRFPSQRLHQTGMFDATGRTIIQDSHGNYIGVPSTPTTIPFNKTFPVPPYVLSASRPLDDKDLKGMSTVDRITTPYIADTQRAYLAQWWSAYSGYFTVATTTNLTVQNMNFNDTFGSFGGSNGKRRVWYSAFENGVS